MNEVWSGLIDAHCHLCDERILPHLDKEVTDAIEAGTTGFLSSALSEEEFEWINLTRFHTFHEYFRWSAGVHPYYEKSSEKDLDRLVHFCEKKNIIAIGEIGLDGRKYNEDWQKEILLKQLEIARNYSLPVIFHCVHKFYDLYKLIERNFPTVRGYLHGFNNSLEVAQHFSRFDMAFSLGCKPPLKNVIDFIVKRGFVLFETDAPYQKAKSDTSEINHLNNLAGVLKYIADTSGESEEELFKMQKKSFHRLFPSP
ncbi:TatD family hydrolase [Candidatus Cloacimonadota bacterium]